MKYNLASGNNTHITKLPKNTKSLKTAIKCPVIYGQAVFNFEESSSMKPEYFIYALEVDRINKFEARSMKELRSDVVYIPTDSDLGRKLINIVAPEDKRTSAKYRGTYEVHDKECYCFLVKSFNIMWAMKREGKETGDLVDLINVVTPEEIQELFPNLNYLFPFEMIQFTEHSQILESFKEIDIFFQKSPFTDGVLCKSLKAYHKYVYDAHLKSFHFSTYQLDGYLSSTSDWKGDKENVAYNITWRVINILSNIFNLSWYTNTKYSVNTDEIISVYNNTSEKIPLSQLIMDTMYITMLSKPERLFNIILDIARPDLENDKYLNEILAYIKYVITDDVELTESIVKDFANTLVNLKE